MKNFILKNLEDLKEDDILFRIKEQNYEILKEKLPIIETSNGEKFNGFGFGGFICTKKVLFRMFKNKGNKFYVYKKAKESQML